eukprot:SAG22_NODE_99_length_20560_cov_128.669029_8_plen_77_part_00
MNDYFHGLQYSESGDCATMVSSNYKMCYDVVPGEQWYREHTKMPECMIHYIARYHGKGYAECCGHEWRDSRTLLAH